LAALATFCLAPGTAFVLAVGGRREIGLIIGASLGFVAVAAQSMLWLGIWAPRASLYALSIVCLLALAAASHAEIASYRLNADQVMVALRSFAAAIQRVRRGTVAHAVIVLVALLLWGASLHGSELSRTGGLGLLQALPPTYFAAFALLLVGFAAAAASDELNPWLLGAYVATLIVLLHGTTPLLYAEPRYAWTYKHLGVINFIGGTGHADRQIDVYNNWPAFFAANAWLSRAVGVGPILYAGWAQLFFNLVDAAAVRFALRGVTADERVLWAATLLFVLGNWVGQDYLAPQAFGFTLSLIVLGLCLRCLPAATRRRPLWNGRPAATRRHAPLWIGRAPGSSRRMYGLRRSQSRFDILAPPLGSRAALLAAGLCYLAVVVSHQLSPLLLIVDIAALAVLLRRVPLWIPMAMIAVEVWWLALAWPFVHAHFAIFDPGGGGAAAPDRNLADALPGAAVAFYSPPFVMLCLAALACVGLVRRWRAGRRDFVIMCLVAAPVLAVALQSYGGEGIYRAYLFALPWLAFLAASAFVSAASRAWAVRLRCGRLLVASAVVAACLLFAYFGQELANRIPSDDVRAATWYEQHAPADSLRINLAPNAPDRLTARYPLVSLADPPSLLAQPGFAGHRLGAADIPRLETYIRRQGNHRAYVVLTRGQENYARLNGLLPTRSVSSLAAALERTPAFRLVYRRASAWIFEYLPGRARPGAGHRSPEIT
jgi:hypothetical protein